MPLAVNLAVAEMNADLAEAMARGEAPALLVLGEQFADHLVQTRLLGTIAQGRRQRTAETMPARGGGTYTLASAMPA
jgi:hypothetical protein